MARMLIGTYASSEEAERVSGELASLCIDPGRIQVHARGEPRHDPDEPLPEDRGVAGFIGRMFSGVTGDASNIRKYEDHAARGGAVLVVDVSASGDDLDRARDAMGADVDEYDSGAGSTAPDARAGADPASANEAIATVGGPQDYVLPNAASEWETSRGGSPSTIGRVGHDPARPQGLLRDTDGLDTDSARVDPRTSASGSSTPATDVDSGDAAAPDALGHRVAENVPGRSRTIAPKR